MSKPPPAGPRPEISQERLPERAAEPAPEEAEASAVRTGVRSGGASSYTYKPSYGGGSR